MAVIKKDKNNRLYIEAIITYPMKLSLQDDGGLEEGGEISDKEANDMVLQKLDMYASSNDGSEWIMNNHSKIEFTK